MYVALLHKFDNWVFDVIFNMGFFFFLTWYTFKKSA